MRQCGGGGAPNSVDVYVVGDFDVRHVRCAEWLRGMFGLIFIIVYICSSFYTYVIMRTHLFHTKHMHIIISG